MFATRLRPPPGHAAATHQRVLRFFLDLHDRLTQSSCAPSSRLALPMKKQDIASYRT